MKIKNIKKTVKKTIYNFVINKVFPQEYKIWTVNQNYLVTKGKNKKVVYTCLTGNYDNIQLQEYLDPSYDYICFTDNQSLIDLKQFGAWQIRPLVFNELNNHFNNRWHKTHPHVLFPEYESSIYIDSNIALRTSFVYKEIEKMNSPLVIQRHFKNDCIYDEAKYAVKLKKLTKAESIKIIDFLKAENFPAHYGLNENNIIFRKHNDPMVIKIMEEWWLLIRDFCKRDQFSLSYVLWKNGIKPSDISIENIRFREDLVRIPYHN